MSKTLPLTIAATVLIGMALTTLPLYGNDREKWTNERVRTELHPIFGTIDINGETFRVTLADGSIYRQHPIHPNMDKVVWDDAYWYVCGGTVIWADSDREAIGLCEQ